MDFVAWVFELHFDCFCRGAFLVVGLGFEFGGLVFLILNVGIVLLGYVFGVDSGFIGFMYFLISFLCVYNVLFGVCVCASGLYLW